VARRTASTLGHEAMSFPIETIDNLGAVALRVR